MPKQKTELIPKGQTKITDWYNKLLDDLWELAQTKVIEMKHLTGKRIIKEWDKFGKPEYGSIFIEGLAKDLKISSSDIYKCIQFARKFPELQNFYNYTKKLEDSVTGYKIPKFTWKYIIKEILPKHKEKRGF